MALAANPLLLVVKHNDLGYNASLHAGMNKQGKIRKYEQKIRDAVNESRRSYALRKDSAAWLQLISSLDVIGDTQLAIEAYADTSVDAEAPRNWGVSYLLIYGLLQALVLQQDAVLHTCEVLQVACDLKNYPGLQQAREIRNNSTGHPTKRDRRGKGQPVTYHAIGRITLKKDGFLLATYTAGGGDNYESIDIPTLLEGHARDIEAILEMVVVKLDEEDRKHREMFKMKKLADVFDQAGYYIEKVFEGVSKGTEGRGQSLPMGKIGVTSIQECLDRFREALAKRGIELGTYTVIEETYELLNFPLAQLQQFFESLESGDKSPIDASTAYIFA